MDLEEFLANATEIPESLAQELGLEWNEVEPISELKEAKAVPINSIKSKPTAESDVLKEREKIRGNLLGLIKKFDTIKLTPPSKLFPPKKKEASGVSGSAGIGLGRVGRFYRDRKYKPIFPKRVAFSVDGDFKIPACFKGAANPRFQYAEAAENDNNQTQNEMEEE